MAFPDELAVCDLVWSIEGGQEIAVNRIWMQHVHHDTVTFSWGDALQTIADHVVTSLGESGSGGGIRSFIHTDCYLNRVDAYQIGVDGKATDKRSHVCTTTEFAGSASGQMLPPIIGPVIQLWGYPPTSYTLHARRHRGRIFMPGATSSILGSDGLISFGNKGDLGSAWGAIFNDLQGMHVGSSFGVGGGPTDSMNVGVLSRTDGAFRQLAAVSVASKPGVQRRRMNKLANGAVVSTAISS